MNSESPPSDITPLNAQAEPNGKKKRQRNRHGKHKPGNTDRQVPVGPSSSASASAAVAGATGYPANSTESKARSRTRNRNNKQLDTSAVSNVERTSSDPASIANAGNIHNISGSGSSAASASTTALPKKTARFKLSLKPSNVSKSTKPALRESADLRDRLSQTLRSQEYECTVCYEPVRLAHQCWSCDNCFMIFHLECIRKWALVAPASASSNALGVSKNKWRCPGCQLERLALPKRYSCFCGKILDPALDREQPHSCTLHCERRLSPIKESFHRISAEKRFYQCPHKCTLVCHPGPCPTCEAMAPQWAWKCHCGSTSVPMRCAELSSSEEFKFGRSCDKVCAKILKCKRHWCRQKCHLGDCLPCAKMIIMKCWCGKSNEERPCLEVTSEHAKYSCALVCNEPFECGAHRCTSKCHEGGHSKCPQSPESISRCPCGKAELSKMPSLIARVICTDPIPSCGNVCDKDYFKPCGHTIRCPKVCHEGDCFDKESSELLHCHESISLSCRCGSETRQVACMYRRAFLCAKLCRQNKSCGRHKCQEVCCPQLHTNHQCDLVCGKKLTCGLHLCQEICHKGKCNFCHEVSFDEWQCSCGKTIQYPPIRCGQPRPECHFSCNRERPCGHPTNIISPHNCHDDTVTCPPCMIFVSKPCLCGKSTVNNVACSASARCPNRCRKPLSCGNSDHLCQMGCHAGPCPDCSTLCGQMRSCGHPCPAKCHGSAECPDPSELACHQTVTRQCYCGNISVNMPCYQRLQMHLSTFMDCNDDCERLQRNQRMAAALQIRADQPFFKVNIPDRIKIFIAKQPKIAGSILAKLREFVESMVPARPFAVFRFPAMRPNYRSFIHVLVEELGSVIGIECEAVDVEPYRSVIVRQMKSTDSIGSQSFKFVNEMLARIISMAEKSDSASNTADLTNAFKEAAIEDRQAVVILNKPTGTCIRDHNHLLSRKPVQYDIVFARAITDPDMVPAENEETTKHITHLELSLSYMSIEEVKPTIVRAIEDIFTSVYEEAIQIKNNACDCLCIGCQSFTWIAAPREPMQIHLPALQVETDNIVQWEVSEAIMTFSLQNLPESYDENVMDWIYCSILEMLKQFDISSRPVMKQPSEP